LIDSGAADATGVRQTAPSQDGGDIAHSFRGPVAEDAAAIFDLIAASPPLDPNSLYCNLLQCTHFAGTCIVAERNGSIEGWISGYRPPDEAEALFVWQVAVHEKARGQRLGVRMLEALFRRPAVANATRLITTVTPSNAASRRMFASFARRHGAELEVRPGFDAERHFGNGHESEEWIAIGPLPSRA
jgi:L-2,4-diaminobutyric acid acetyltransferase